MKIVGRQPEFSFHRRRIATNMSSDGRLFVTALYCASILVVRDGGVDNALSVSAFSGPRLSQLPSISRHRFDNNYHGITGTRRRMNDRVGDDTDEDGTDRPSPLFDIDLIERAPGDGYFRVEDVIQTIDPDVADNAGQFYDDDDDEDDLYGDDDDLYSNSIVDSGTSLHNEQDPEDELLLDYERDDDDMRTEREDRLYVDDSGRRVKVETCVLVGVEALSKMRKDRSNRRRKLLAEHDQNAVDGAVNRLPEDLDLYFSLEESMTEMRDLIKTAGLELVGEVTQRLNEVNPRTYIGTGKLKDVQALMNDLDSCTVVFDAELSPGQQKALENAFNKEIIQNDFLGAEQIGQFKVVDRTALILDIFAQHAKTREGKLQVDLALHEYRKPRLTKMWTHLERQSGSGGVGLRGPGESQLEIDRRLIRDRIIVLKRKIDDVQTHRDIHRKGRERMGLPVLAIVGYTNAGKSTLLNYLTRAGVMAEDILFATLDPTTRKVKLPGLKTHPEVLLTDTVGFIQKLPTQLVAAFRATLEEVREADVLVHVMDVTSPVWEKQESAVMQVLNDIGAGDKKIVRVFNKIDGLENEEAMEDAQLEAAMMPGHAVAISALTGEGMVDFVATVEDALMDLLCPVEVLIPYTNGREVNMVQEVGHVETIEYREDGTYIQARVPEAIANRLASFNVAGSEEQNTIDSKNANASLEEEEEEEIDWVSIGRGRHSTK